MSKSEQIILELFDSKPEATTAEIVECTGLARRTVQKYLSILVAKHRLDALGHGRGRFYRRVYTSNEALSHLAVLKSDRLIGKLTYGNGSYTFVYDEGYTGVELLGIAREGSSQSSTLYPVFENLLPEYERRDRLLTEVQENADILPSLHNVQGDFRFIPYYELYRYKSIAQTRPAWHTVKHKILGENNYPNLIGAQLLISDEILEEVSSKAHSSLSGYQHKIDITIDFTRGTIEESAQDADYLLKPLNRTMVDYFARDGRGQKRYYPFLALNEHLFMSFAKNELKLNTPMSGIVRAKGGDFHYVVKRYDRYEKYAYGQYDMAQLLDIPSQKKYSVDTITILEAFAKKVKDEKFLLDMLRFQIYASLIQHSDFHAKNMSVLDIGRDKFALAPLYDVISVGVYNGESEDLGLPLTSSIRKFSKYSIDDFLMMASALGIGKSRAKITMRQTIETYLNRFPVYIEKTIAFEQELGLLIQDTRIGKKHFSKQLRSMYDRKVVQLKKQGVLQELGLIEKYGGKLKSEKKRADDK